MENNIEIRLSVSGHIVVFKYGGKTLQNYENLHGIATLIIDGKEVEKVRGISVKRNHESNRFYFACVACCTSAGYKRMVELRRMFKSERGISRITSKHYGAFVEYVKDDEVSKLYDEIEKALEPYKRDA